MSKHVSAATVTLVTMEELLEAMVLCGPCRGYITRNSCRYGQPSPWTATLTWWEGLCLFDSKKADQRQSEIK
jgi:hypothetical protein